MNINTAAERVLALLKERSLRLATAESCTGGLLSGYITQISGASGVFDCGIISYSNEIKARLLSVNEDDLRKYGAVSAEVAKAMASGVKALANADIGLGITGIAGPLSDNTSKPVGLIYIALAGKNGVIAEEFKNDFKDDVRKNNRLFAVKAALSMLEEYIINSD